MTRTLTISDTGLRLIKAFEGYRPEDRKLVTGARVVGYGHRIADDETMELTRNEAEEWLLDDLIDIEEVVNDEVHAPLSQGQFDALVSLAFNIGIDAFRSSDVVRAMNNGRVLDAANGFDVWRKATIAGKTYVVDALMRRRTAEKSLFLKTDATVPAPSAMLVPIADATAPLGPTDDGMPRLSSAEGAGIVAEASILDEETLADDTLIEEPADVPVSVLTLSDLADAEAMQDEMRAAETIEVETVDEPVVMDDPVITDDTVIVAKEELEIDPAEDLLDLDVHDADTTASLDEPDTDSEIEVDAVEEIDSDDFAVIDEPVLDEHELDLEENEAASPITAAADSLGERLSALLDADDDDEPLTETDLPQSLTLASENETGQEGDDGRSNLLSFPTPQRVMPEDETPVEDVDDAPEPTETEDGVIVIDNLAADDVMRSSQDAADADAPDGDPVENAMRYLESRAEEQPARKGGGLWIPLIIGAGLVGASGVLIGRGATELLSDWGPTAATSAAITGALMVLFAIYAAARGRFA